MWNDRIVIEKHNYVLGNPQNPENNTGVEITEYTASIYEFYYDDDGKYLSHASTPTIVGCGGETPEEAIANLRGSLTLMLESISRVETGVNSIAQFDVPSSLNDFRERPLDADDAYMEERYGEE